PAIYTLSLPDALPIFMLLRDMGRLCFATLRDSSGAVQLMATAKGTERYDELTALNLGDWVVATGEVVRSKKGELSVRVERWQLRSEEHTSELQSREKL